MKISIQSKFLMLFAAAGLSVASAKSYDISVPDHSELAGKQLKAGDYTVKVQGTTATLRNEGSTTIAATGSIQTADKKFSQTQVEVSTGSDGVNHITAIDLGGTNTKLTFNN